jgi:hypothetical protein
MQIKVDFYIYNKDFLEVNYKTKIDLLVVSRRVVKEKMLSKYNYFDQSLINGEDYKYDEKEKSIKFILKY